MRLTGLEVMLIAGMVLLALCPVMIWLSGRQGARLAGLWVPMGLGGVYLAGWSYTEHVRWLIVIGVPLIVASYLVQFAVWRAARRQDRGTTPGRHSRPSG